MGLSIGGTGVYLSKNHPGGAFMTPREVQLCEFTTTL